MGFLSKLFGKIQEKTNALEKSIEEVKKEREGYISIGKNLYPVIKSADDPKLKMSVSNNPIITEPLSDGIVVCYVLDLGDTFEMISEHHLENFGLTLDNIKQAAYRNLIDKLNTQCKIGVMDFSNVNPEIKPFYKIDMDSNFNPSIMLIDEFWETTAKEVCQSDIIAVSIPAKNIIFFSDMKLMESFRTMRPVADQMYESSIQDGIQLTKSTYIRKNGKWILYLNTEKQWIDLLLEQQ